MQKLKGQFIVHQSGKFKLGKLQTQVRKELQVSAMFCMVRMMRRKVRIKIKGRSSKHVRAICHQGKMGKEGNALEQSQNIGWGKKKKKRKKKKTLSFTCWQPESRKPQKNMYDESNRDRGRLCNRNGLLWRANACKGGLAAGDKYVHIQRLTFATYGMPWRPEAVGVLPWHSVGPLFTRWRRARRCGRNK